LCLKLNPGYVDVIYLKKLDLIDAIDKKRFLTTTGRELLKSVSDPK